MLTDNTGLLNAHSAEWDTGSLLDLTELDDSDAESHYDSQIANSELASPIIPLSN